MKTLKSKKTIVLISLATLALISAFITMTSCSILNQSKEPTQNDYAHEAYNQVVDQYNQALAEYNSIEGADYRFWYHTIDRYPYVDGLDISTPAGYTYLDLDDDGVDELITKDDKGYLICIYSYIGGKPVEVSKFWSRNWGKLCTNKIIENQGSGGAFTGNLNFCKLNIKDASSTTSQTNLKTIEGICWDYLPGYPEKFEHKTVNDDDTYTTTTFTKDQLAQERSTLEAKYPEDKNVVWIPFSPAQS